MQKTAVVGCVFFVNLNLNQRLAQLVNLVAREYTLTQVYGLLVPGDQCDWKWGTKYVLESKRIFGNFLQPATASDDNPNVNARTTTEET